MSRVHYYNCILSWNAFLSLSVFWEHGEQEGSLIEMTCHPECSLDVEVNGSKEKFKPALKWLKWRQTDTQYWFESHTSRHKISSFPCVVWFLSFLICTPFSQILKVGKSSWYNTWHKIPCLLDLWFFWAFNIKLKGDALRDACPWKLCWNETNRCN